MATNFKDVGITPVGFPLKRRFRSMLADQTKLSIVGLTSTSAKLTINFDRTPILSAPADTPGGWAISGGTVVTVTGVSVVGNTIELTTAGSYDTSNYQLAIPSAGLSSDSGVTGFPYLFYGPYYLTFALGSQGGGTSAFNGGFN